MNAVALLISSSASTFFSNLESYYQRPVAVASQRWLAGRKKSVDGGCGRVAGIEVAASACGVCSQAILDTLEVRAGPGIASVRIGPFMAELHASNASSCAKV